MPSRVLDFLDYNQQDFVTETVDPSVQSPVKGVTSYSGLSPFDVPEQVELEATPDDACHLRFHYADEERPASSPVGLVGDPDIYLKVGRRTGKILEVVIRHAAERLLANRVAIDLSRASTRAYQLAVDESALKNYALVSQITESALSSLKNELLRAWKVQGRDASTAVPR